MLHRGVLFALLFVQLTAGYQGEQKDTSSGSQATTPGKYPSVVSLQINGLHFCGGSLISRNIVLTAAHCASPVLPTVVIGAYNLESTIEFRETIQAAEWIVHPQFTKVNVPVNDVALLRLLVPTKIVTSFARPIFLQSAARQIEMMTAGASAIAVGWGYSSPSEILQEITLPIVAQSECARAYPGKYVSNVMICAGVDSGDVDSCQGDSGGPLFSASHTDVQIGITSFGVSCASPDLFGVFTQLNSFASFVFANVNFASATPTPTLRSPSTTPSPSVSNLVATCGHTVSGTTVKRPSTFGDPAGDATFRIHFPHDVIVSFNACASKFDTVLTLLDSNDRVVAYCDDCGGCGLRTNLEISGLSAGTYSIVVDGFETNEGEFALAISCEFINLTPTASPTSSHSITGTRSSTRSNTLTPLISKTGTPTSSGTPLISTTPSKTKSSTKSPSATQTASPSVTPTKSRTASPSKTRSASASSSVTASRTISPSKSASHTLVPSSRPSNTPTASFSRSPSRSITASVSATLSPSTTQTPSRTKTRSNTASKTQSPTPTKHI
eukprot:c17117_g1_i1.p1 GENE.c17117_g1_i1~~c17117_g1_i1.p1  ORF type:complete len:555 (+),score=104.86 c17117_g1_i1:1308-2972(+)